ncbi:MAG: 1-acyl-sn-glycerol-3-phosphate acyltransferase, partial [Gammaproteobacteria bacterium]|nr:1-acyl-sn-glycerol-3-phosphate acyltransferase [Gammaproteobacteria bacterium]
DKPSIVLMNHQAQWETMALLVIIPAHAWVLKRELFKLPFFGWALRVLKPIAIDRGAGKKALKQLLEQGKERLGEGLWIVVYPEGTRVPLDKTLPYKSGGALLAKETGVDVVPMAHNAGTLWRHKSLLRLPGTIDVHIGPPINPADKSVKEINAEVRAWVDQHAKTNSLDFVIKQPTSAVD